MALLIAIPILGSLAVLESSVISRFTLLHGTADLVMLTIIAWALQKRVQTAWQWSIIGGLAMNITSAIPLGVPVFSYAVITGMALVVRRRVWQVPILAMFLVTFTGTLVSQGITLFVLRLTGSNIDIVQALNLITLPSLLMNLLFAIPVYALVTELADWLYPEELEV